MSASESSRADWLDNSFWERLDSLEARHQRLQSEHEAVRRGLERVRAHDGDELREAWDRYCAVIADLDSTTAELGSPAYPRRLILIVPPKLLSRRALEELGELQALVRQLSTDRNVALRIFTASRFVAIASAQREFWLEFSWLDQEYRVAVRRLADFCSQHRHAA